MLIWNKELDISVFMPSSKILPKSLYLNDLMYFYAVFYSSVCECNSLSRMKIIISIRRDALGAGLWFAQASFSLIGIDQWQADSPFKNVMIFWFLNTP